MSSLEQGIAFSFLKTLFIYLFIYIYSWLHWVFIAVCRLSLVVGAQGLLSLASQGLLVAVASLAAEHRGLEVAAHGLSSCGPRALEHSGLSSCSVARGIPRPGIESPALAGRFPTTGPPGNSCNYNFRSWKLHILMF